MFCPVCKVEYRSGFTHCTDCDVDLVQELPAAPARIEYETAIADVWRGKSRTKSVVTFALHQFIGMYGIPFTAPIVFSLGFKCLLLFGRSYPKRAFYSIVSETPYFPVQIIFAVILGWLLGRALRHRSIVWVWVLPLGILCYSVATFRVLIPTSMLATMGQSRFSHYFGWGCQPKDHCLDQLLITMPFYTCLAYSMGAAIARRAFGYADAKSRGHFLAVTVAGYIVVAAFVIDLFVSAQQAGWHGLYFLMAVTPTIVAAVLLYVGLKMRRQPISTVNS
jgi:hypothetical protein